MSQAVLRDELGSVQAKLVLRGAKRDPRFVEDNQEIQQAVGRVLFVVMDNYEILQAVE